MQSVKTIAIIVAILLVLLACGTTHVMATVAGVFSVASVVVFCSHFFSWCSNPPAHLTLKRLLHPLRSHGYC